MQLIISWTSEVFEMTLTKLGSLTMFWEKLVWVSANIKKYLYNKLKRQDLLLEILFYST